MTTELDFDTSTKCLDHSIVIDQSKLCHPILKVYSGIFQYLEITDLYALSMTCKGVYVKVCTDVRWFNRLGYRAITILPRNFNSMKAYHEMLRGTKLLEKRKLMTTNARVHRELSMSLKPLIVCLKKDTSQLIAGLRSSLQLSTAPTTADAKKLKNQVDKLERDVLNVVLSELQKNKLNRKMCSYLAHLLLLAPPSDSFKICDITTKLLTDINSVCTLVSLINGESIDNLSATKKLKIKKNLNSRARRVVVNSLLQMNTLKIFEIFTNEYKSTMKNLFRSIHIGAVLTKKLHVPEVARLMMFVNWIRGVKYPSSQKELDDAKWKLGVVTPLTTLLDRYKILEWSDKSSLAQWTSSTFQPDLQGKKLPKPFLNTPKNLLARLGNTQDTWLRLFESRQMSSASVSKNLRSLILCDIDTSLVRDIISSSSSNPRDLLKAMKIIPSLHQTQEIRAMIEANLKLEKKKHASRSWIQVVMGKKFVKDKKGNITELDDVRKISKSFGVSTVKSYRDIFVEAMDVSLAKLYEDKSARHTNNVAVIGYTTQMSQNLLRRGEAPLLPPFCTSLDEVMWSGEKIGLTTNKTKTSVSTKSKKRPKVERRICAGISWCEPEDKSLSSVDLDLSLLLFDANWVYLDHCSYQKLKIAGAKHSGDITAAPFPKGAREAVEISTREFRNGFPTCRYVCICVYSFTGQPMEKLKDASVFVTDPNATGSGPDNTKLLAASRLQGQGTCFFVGYLEIKDTVLKDHAECWSFTQCSQLLNTNTRSATSSSNLIRETMQRMVLSEKESPSLRIYEYASFVAANLANVVVLYVSSKKDKNEKDKIKSHALCPSKAVVLNREKDETTTQFFLRICDTLQSSRAADSPVYELPKGVDGENVVLFNGSSSLDYVETCRVVDTKGKLHVVNLCSSPREEGGELLKDIGIRKQSVRVFGGQALLNELYDVVVLGLEKKKEEEDSSKME